DVLFQKFSRMARNLDLKKVDSNSEIFFIVDRVFAEAINPKDLSPLIKNSRFSAHELDEIARRYVEMELALLIRNVNESLSKNLKGNTTTTANLISDAKDHSRQLYVQIMNFLRKADLVHNLVKFVSQYKSQEIQKKTKDFFEGM